MKNSVPFSKKPTQTKNLKLAIPLITSIALTITSQSLFAGNYLDELAVEAESTANIVSSNQLEPADKKKFDKMEALLKTEWPTTYKFYSKLYPKNKEKVFQFYADDQSDRSDRLSHLRQKVMDIYFTQ